MGKALKAIIRMLVALDKEELPINPYDSQKCTYIYPNGIACDFKAMDRFAEGDLCSMHAGARKPVFKNN